MLTLACKVGAARTVEPPAANGEGGHEAGGEVKIRAILQDKRSVDPVRVYGHVCRHAFGVHAGMLICTGSQGQPAKDKSSAEQHPSA